MSMLAIMLSVFVLNVIMLIALASFFNIDNLSVENDDDVVPLALLDEVRKPDPGAEVAGEVRMPIAAFTHRS